MEASSSRDARAWEEAERRASSSIEAVRASLRSFPSGPLRVSRVAQLDAALLDSELEGILSGPVVKALEGVRGGNDWNVELMALMRLAVLKLSLFDKGATYGSVLQNLKYRDERKHVDGLQSTAVDSSPSTSQKAAYVAVQVLPLYMLGKLRDRMTRSSWADEPLPRSWLSLLNLRRLARRNQDDPTRTLAGEWKRTVWELVNASERIWAVLDLVNFLVFLYDGKYRSLVDRLLKMRLIYAQRSISRNVSFEFLNRQLVWEAFTEFLLFLMPLVNLHRLRVRLTRLVMNKANNSKTLNAVVRAVPLPVARALRLPILNAKGKGKADDEIDETVSRGPLYFLSKDTCPICYSTYYSSTAPASSALSTTAIPSDPTTSTAALASLTHVTNASSSNSKGGDGPTNEETVVKMPYVANCGNGCRYCYYCITSRLVQADEAAEDSWDCLRCGRDVTGADRESIEAQQVDNADEDDADDPGREEKGDKDGRAASEHVEEVESVAESVGTEHERWR